MPRSQAQRLRYQLAASLVAAAQEHEVTERRLLERIAAADARCQEALQRAEVAEVNLLHHVESEQRTGLLRDENSALDELRDRFPVAFEGASRAELAAAEEAAWAKLAVAQAANRKAVKRSRESLRKRRQKQCKGQRERRNLPGREPAPQGDGSVGSPPDDFATARSVMSSASSTAVSGYNALFVDNICFWIAAFVPHSWAPVCSKAARTVFRVMNIYEQGWFSVGAPIAYFQSMGSHYVLDHERIGPECGLPYAAHLSVQALRNEVWQLMRSNPAAASPGWASRWILHMDFQYNMYEKLRLEHKGLYIAVNEVLITCGSAVGHIGQALEAFDQRQQAEVDEVGAADDSAVNNSDASV